MMTKDKNTTDASTIFKIEYKELQNGGFEVTYPRYGLRHSIEVKKLNDFYPISADMHESLNDYFIPLIRAMASEEA